VLDRATLLSWKKGGYRVTATAGEEVAKRTGKRDGSGREQRDPDQLPPSPPSRSVGRAAGLSDVC